MPKFRLSLTAESDISNIARYTIERFGVEQARTYRDAIIACFQSLAENPSIGRKTDNIRDGYRRFNHRSHVIFYKSDGQDILIIRVLHKRMNSPRHI